MTGILAIGLATSLYADDKTIAKSKTETIDPVTGDKVKSKSKAKIEHDGDYKEKTETKDTATGQKVKHKVKVKPNGEVKEKVESH